MHYPKENCFWGKMLFNKMKIMIHYFFFIVDHIQKTEGFTLNHLRYLVIDEADRVMEDVQNDWLVFTFFCFS